ncbi:MAG: hypothetical protein ABIH36_00200 [bacterium]
MKKLLIIVLAGLLIAPSAYAEFRVLPFSYSTPYIPYNPTPRIAPSVTLPLIPPPITTKPVARVPVTPVDVTPFDEARAKLFADWAETNRVSAERWAEKDRLAKEQQAAKVVPEVPNYLVPWVIGQIFSDVYGHKITPSESTYWKNRMRTDKPTIASLQGAMYWHKSHGSTGVTVSQVAGATMSSTDLVGQINSLFRSVYERNPSISENKYWLTRIADKPTEEMMLGAMIFHKLNNISH